MDSTEEESKERGNDQLSRNPSDITLPEEIKNIPHRYLLIADEIFSICFFSLFGVFFRYILSTTFKPSNLTYQWPFIDIFYLHSVLISNMIGSFIMAIILCHKESIINFSEPLFKGLTVGFCGCFTSFSSWFAEFIFKFKTDNWYHIFVEFVVEFSLIWVSYIFGLSLISFTSSIFRNFHSNYSILKINLFSSFKYNPFYSKSSKKSDRSSSNHDEKSEENEIQMEMRENGPIHIVVNRTKSDSLEPIQLDDESFVSSVPPDGDIDIEEENSVVDWIEENSNKQRSYFVYFLKSAPSFSEFRIWVLFFFISYLVIWVIIITDYTRNYLSAQERLGIRSVVLAPFGVLIRYGTSKVDKIRLYWPEIQLQTLLVNLIGVVIYVAIDLYSGSWEWKEAFLNGVMGSMTTVSSFIAELYNLYNYTEEGPFYSFRYFCATTFIAFALVQIINV